MTNCKLNTSAKHVSSYIYALCSSEFRMAITITNTTIILYVYGFRFFVFISSLLMLFVYLLLYKCSHASNTFKAAFICHHYLDQQNVFIK